MCDFCGGDLAALEAAHAESVAEIRAATAALRAALQGRLGAAPERHPDESRDP